MARLGGRSRWYRRALRLTLLPLFLGFVTMWVVAWGCASLARPVLPEPPVNTSGLLYRYYDDRGAGYWIVSFFAETEGWAVDDPDYPPPAWSDGSRWLATQQLPEPEATACTDVEEYGIDWLEFAYGWPLLCLRGRLAQGGSDYVSELPIQEGPVCALRLDQNRFLPYGPIWLGIALDSLCFALLWLVLLLVPAGARRRWRKRRGRCLRCGYDLRGGYDAGCPECGKGRVVSVEETTGGNSTKRRKRIRRVPFLLGLVLLLLGMLTTWFVGWGMALYGYSPHARYQGVSVGEDATFAANSSKGRGVELVTFDLIYSSSEEATTERILETGLVPTWTETYVLLQRHHLTPPCLRPGSKGAAAASSAPVTVDPLGLVGDLPFDPSELSREAPSLLAQSSTQQSQQPGGGYYSWTEQLSGWPMLALRTPITPGDLNQARRKGTGLGVLRLPKVLERFLPRPVRRILPHHPSWFGFTVDTLFYAALWVPIALLFLWLRSRWRRHRGRCPVCKYDLHAEENAGCPECGWERG